MEGQGLGIPSARSLLKRLEPANLIFDLAAPRCRVRVRLGFDVVDNLLCDLRFVVKPPNMCLTGGY